MFSLKKVIGDSTTDLILVEVGALKKAFSYACYEQQQNKFYDPNNILFIDELSLKSERHKTVNLLEVALEF